MFEVLEQISLFVLEIAQVLAKSFCQKVIGGTIF